MCSAYIYIHSQVCHYACSIISPNLMLHDGTGEGCFIRRTSACACWIFRDFSDQSDLFIPQFLIPSLCRLVLQEHSNVDVVETAVVDTTHKSDSTKKKKKKDLSKRTVVSHFRLVRSLKSHFCAQISALIIPSHLHLGLPKGTLPRCFVIKLTLIFLTLQLPPLQPRLP